MENKVNISDIVGQIGNLYYCNDMNCFQLGSVKFELLEDESDGYRSSMDCLKILSTNSECHQLLAEIKIVDISTDNQTIYALQDTKDNSFNQTITRATELRKGGVMSSDFCRVFEFET